MKCLFLTYPRCGTCKKAKIWLDENYIDYELRDIVEENPKFDELKEWIEKSELPIKKFFNTSGMLYKEMKIKDKLENMSDDEKIKLLSTNGMLVKRPIIVYKDIILLGFKEEEWIKIKNKLS